MSARLRISHETEDIVYLRSTIALVVEAEGFSARCAHEADSAKEIERSGCRVAFVPVLYSNTWCRNSPGDVILPMVLPIDDTIVLQKNFIYSRDLIFIANAGMNLSRQLPGIGCRSIFIVKC